MKKNRLSQVFLISISLFIALLMLLFYQNTLQIKEIYQLASEYVNLINIYYLYIFCAAIFVILWVLPTPLLALTIVALTILKGFAFVVLVNTVSSIVLWLIITIFYKQFHIIAAKILFLSLRIGINNRKTEMGVFNLALVSIIPIVPQFFKTYFYIFYKMNTLKLLKVLILSNIILVGLYGFIGSLLKNMLFKETISPSSMLAYTALLIIAIVSMLIRISYNRKLTNLTK